VVQLEISDDQGEESVLDPSRVTKPRARFVRKRRKLFIELWSRRESVAMGSPVTVGHFFIGMKWQDRRLMYKPRACQPPFDGIAPAHLPNSNSSNGQHHRAARLGVQFSNFGADPWNPKMSLATRRVPRCAVRTSICILLCGYVCGFSLKS
jgi:hypothetical protein